MARRTKGKLTYHKGKPVFKSGGHRYVYKKGWGMVKIGTRKRRKR